MRKYYSPLLTYAVAVIVISTSLNLTAQDHCQPVGWVTENGGITGGGNATASIVSNYADFKTAMITTSVKVVRVSGTITIPPGGRITFQDQSGKTVYGMPGARLISTDMTKNNSGILYIQRCSNIIIKNIVFEGPGAYDVDGWDNITIDDSKNIWVDHCEFGDAVDGNLDIKNAADFISITWCKFVYNKAPIPGGPGGSPDHRFSNLFGSGDDAIADRGKLRITLQNCWWAQGCKARMPRVCFGKVHVVNNYFNTSASTYCVQAGFEADLLIEGNVFESVKYPIDQSAKTFTAITERNNIFTNITGTIAGSGTAFSPPYKLNVSPASEVKAKVTAGAGATITAPGICFPLSIESFGEKEYSLIAYPNPFNDKITLSLNGPFKYSVQNMTGIILENGNGVNYLTIGSELSKGLYFVQISNPTISRVLKIEKE